MWASTTAKVSLISRNIKFHLYSSFCPQGRVDVCPEGVGLHPISQVWARAFKGLQNSGLIKESQAPQDPSRTFPSSAVATEMFCFCWCWEHVIFYKHISEKILFLCSQMNQQDNCFRHSAPVREISIYITSWGRKSALHLELVKDFTYQI